MAGINLAQHATICSGTTLSSTFFTARTSSFFLPPDSATWRRNGRHSKGMATPECSSSSGMTDSQGGRIVRQVLSKEGRTKVNPASDRGFYSAPRLVTHVDDQFLSTLTSLYRERIADDAEVLDLMSSWVSHLPGTGLQALNPEIRNCQCSIFSIFCPKKCWVILAFLSKVDRLISNSLGAVVTCTVKGYGFVCDSLTSKKQS